MIFNIDENNFLESDEIESLFVLTICICLICVSALFKEIFSI